ncbi:MAG TPA: hypothetical protein VGD07_20260, partial [Methylomirabilota bacterium]
RDRLPVTRLHMLTNGRMFSYRSIVKRLAEVRHPQLTLGIPLYSDHCVVHDYVVQAQGAFDQTVSFRQGCADAGLAAAGGGLRVSAVGRG